MNEIDREIMSERLGVLTENYEFFRKISSKESVKVAQSVMDIMSKNEMTIYFHLTTGWKLIQDHETLESGLYYWKPNIVGRQKGFMERIELCEPN